MVRHPVFFWMGCDLIDKLQAKTALELFEALLEGESIGAYNVAINCNLRATRKWARF